VTRREAAYNKKLQELIDKVGDLEDSKVEKVVQLLENARSEVAARVASTEWDMYYIPQLKEAVDRALTTFKQRYGSEQEVALNNMWNAGIDMVDSPLQFVGIRAAAPEISRSALEILQGYSADLIGGLTADAAKKINSEIALGIMGAKPVQEVMRAVGRNLDDPSVFGTIGSRAEAITRTEMARVNSAAREARAEGTAHNNPELQWMKKWISSGKFHPRPNHAALNGVMVPVDENFPGGIPYPHAPGLPASEVVNCA
jgi:hypothetical protein